MRSAPSTDSASDRPSEPICTSVMSVTPFDWHSSHSEAVIARDAPVMSAVCGPTPSQKMRMPPPVPVDSTIGAEPPVEAANSSDAACEYGNTVDEPTTRIWSTGLGVRGAGGHDASGGDRERARIGEEISRVISLKL